VAHPIDDNHHRQIDEQLRNWQDQDWDRSMDQRRSMETTNSALASFARGYLTSAALHHAGMSDTAVEIATEVGESADSREPPPDPAISALQVARRRLDAGEFFRAQVALEQYAKNGHRHPLVHFLYGRALFAQDRLAAAAEAFQNARRRGAPQDACVELIARCELRMERPAVAERVISSVIEADHGSVELHFLRGRARLLSPIAEKAVGAADDFRRVTSARPKDALARHWLARALIRAQQAAEGLVVIAEAVSLGLPESEILFDRGIAHLDLSDFQEAEEDFTRLLNERPGFPPALSMRALARKRRGDYDGARDDLSTVLEITPRRMALWIDRGDCFLQLGQFDQALQDFEQAEKLAPKSPQPPYHRGCCLLRMNRREEALAAIERSLELGPGFEPAIQLREECWRA